MLARGQVGKLVSGNNDIAMLFSEMAAEPDGWDPSSITLKSEKKLNWRSLQGHSWEASFCYGTRHTGSGCPVCSCRRVVAGFNDLATRNPEVARQVDGCDPRTLAAVSRKKMPWSCDEGHVWDAAVRDRTGPKGTGCPVCGGKRVLTNHNDLAINFPAIAAEADG